MRCEAPPGVSIVTNKVVCYSVVVASWKRVSRCEDRPLPGTSTVPCYGCSLECDPTLLQEAMREGRVVILAIPSQFQTSLAGLSELRPGTVVVDCR